MIHEGKEWLKGETTPVVQFNKVLKEIAKMIQEVCDKKLAASCLQMYVRGLLDGNTFCRTAQDIAPTLAKKKKKRKKKK